MGEKGAKLMIESTQSFDRVTEILRPLGDITGRKMFGGYGIFEGGAMFALVNSRGDVFFKVDESNRWRFDEIAAKRHGKMPYFQVSDDVLSNQDSLREWAKEAMEIAHKSKGQQAGKS